MIDRIYLTIIFLITLGSVGYVGYQKIQAAEDEINRLRENSKFSNKQFKSQQKQLTA